MKQTAKEKITIYDVSDGRGPVPPELIKADDQQPRDKAA
jgi:hypothetical protein